MNVLQVTACDLGGAGIAAGRIHRAVREFSSWESRLLCLNPRTPDGEPLPLPQARSVRLQRLRMLAGRILAPSRKAVWQSSNLLPSGLPGKLASVPGEVVHLHWPNDELLSVREFAEFRRPVVWTLHDCWPFLPTAHYAVEPVDGIPSGFLRAAAWNRKREIFPSLEWQIVCPTEWMKKRAEESGLFAKAELRVVPHPLPERFRPAPRTEARNRFGIGSDRPVWIFRSAPGNERTKGIDLIRAAMEAIGGQPLWISYGEGEPGTKTDNWRHLGPLCAEELVSLYSAADLLVAPSRFESFGMSVQECLGCGTPVLVLEGTAAGEFVVPGENGFRAEESSVVETLRSAPGSAPASDDRRAGISEAVHRAFSPAGIAARYERIYERAAARRETP